MSKEFYSGNHVKYFSCRGCRLGVIFCKHRYISNEGREAYEYVVEDDDTHRCSIVYPWQLRKYPSNQMIYYIVDETLGKIAQVYTVGEDTEIYLNGLKYEFPDHQFIIKHVEVKLY